MAHRVLISVISSGDLFSEGFPFKVNYQQKECPTICVLFGWFEPKNRGCFFLVQMVGLCPICRGNPSIFSKPKGHLCAPRVWAWGRDSTALV